MSEETPGGNSPGEGNEPGGDDVTKDGDGEQKKLVTLERHKSELAKRDGKITELQSKVSAFEKAEEERKNSEMTDNERLKKENEALKKTNSAHEAEGRKREAYSKAKAALDKAGKVINPEAKEALKSSISKLGFNADTVDEDVAGLVNLAAVPKGSSYRTAAGKTGSDENDGRDPLSYTGKELGEISKESPERYQAIMAKRKTALQAKAAEAKSGK